MVHQVLFFFNMYVCVCIQSLRLYNSLSAHGLWHTRLPCPSLPPRGCSNSCPLSWPFNHFHPLPPILLLPILVPSIRVFSIQSTLCIRWSKYWSFSISLSNEYSGLIFFRIDCFDLPAVQRTLKSLPQPHSLRRLLRVYFFLNIGIFNVIARSLEH